CIPVSFQAALRPSVVLVIISLNREDGSCASLVDRPQTGTSPPNPGLGQLLVCACSRSDPERIFKKIGKRWATCGALRIQSHRVGEPALRRFHICHITSTASTAPKAPLTPIMSTIAANQ